MDLSLARGEKLTISNVLLRSLGKCSEKYFIAHHDKVLDSTISLKDLAENFKEAIEVDKVTIVLSFISGLMLGISLAWDGAEMVTDLPN